MLKIIITLVKVIVTLIILSVVAYIIIDNQVVAKANDFCDKEVVIGKLSSDLIEKAKKVSAKPYLVDSNLRGFFFTGSARPTFCYISIADGIITAKHVESSD